MCSHPSSMLPLPDLRLRPRSSRGFTLLEIMLVVAIIALLLAAGFNQLGGVFTMATDTRVKADINTFSSKLKLYEATAGNLPTNEQGLQALVTRPAGEPQPTKWYPFMDKVNKDPWNQDYIYVQPGLHNPQSFDVYTKGKDRIAGTADDVGNWDEPVHN